MPALRLFVVSSVDQKLRGRTGKNMGGQKYGKAKIWEDKNTGRQKYERAKIWEGKNMGRQKYGRPKI
jgi:hypothetical protein